MKVRETVLPSDHGVVYAEGGEVCVMQDWFTRDPDDRHLANDPLGLVVCQIRHEHEVAASDPSRILQIQEELGWATQLAESSVQEFNFVVSGGPGGSPLAPPAPGGRGWQLRSEDGVWLASVLPDSFSLEVTEYPGWDEFRARMLNLASAVLKYIGPSLEHRVGLRFVNQIDHPDVQSPADWTGLISKNLFQNELFEGLGSQVQAALQVLQIHPTPGNSLVLRHGLQLDGRRWKYLIDSDCSRQGTRRLSEDSLKDSIEGLHRLILQAFELATTPELRAYLEKESI